MTNSKYGRIISIATMVCTILLGIAFIVSTAHLYFTGGSEPYSRERVGEYLAWLIVPSVITLLLVVVGVVYNIATSTSDTENTKRTDRELLESFEGRYNLSDFDEETKKSLKAEKKKTLTFSIEFHSVSALLFLASLIYIAFVAEFTVENLSADIMAAFAVALPLSAVGIAIQIPRVYLAEKSAARQLTLMKESIKAHGAPKVKKAEKAEKYTKATLITRYAILGAALLLIVLGIFNGGAADVLGKAVKICTECIGLG